MREDFSNIPGKRNNFVQLVDMIVSALKIKSGTSKYISLKQKAFSHSTVIDVIRDFKNNSVPVFLESDTDYHSAIDIPPLTGRIILFKENSQIKYLYLYNESILPLFIQNSLIWIWYFFAKIKYIIKLKLTDFLKASVLDYKALAGYIVTIPFVLVLLILRFIAQIICKILGENSLAMSAAEILKINPILLRRTGKLAVYEIFGGKLTKINNNPVYIHENFSV